MMLKFFSAMEFLCCTGFHLVMLTTESAKRSHLHCKSNCMVVAAKKSISIGDKLCNQGEKSEAEFLFSNSKFCIVLTFSCNPYSLKEEKITSSM